MKAADLFVQALVAEGVECIFALPGEFDTVGISDGTDAWIAPVIAEPFAGQGIKVGQLLQQIRDGTFKGAVSPPPPPPPGRRRILLTAEPAPAPSRRRIVING